MTRYRCHICKAFVRPDFESRYDPERKVHIIHYECNNCFSTGYIYQPSMEETL